MFAMNAKAVAPVDQDYWSGSANAHATDRTGQTDNERIKDITVLPPS
jgi:3-deoxy-7-phosphoheptulonate synthase